MHAIQNSGWCPSIAWMKGLRSVVRRLLIEPVAKVRGRTIAQQVVLQIDTLVLPPFMGAENETCKIPDESC